MTIIFLDTVTNPAEEFIGTATYAVTPYSYSFGTFSTVAYGAPFQTFYPDINGFASTTSTYVPGSSTKWMVLQHRESNPFTTGGGRVLGVTTIYAELEAEFEYPSGDWYPIIISKSTGVILSGTTGFSLSISGKRSINRYTKDYNHPNYQSLVTG